MSESQIDQWRRADSEDEATFESHIPGNPERTFRWHLLRGDESAAAYDAARLRLEKKYKRQLNVFDADRLEAESQWEILFRTMRVHGRPERKVAQNVGELRSFLRDDERDALIVEYLDLEDQRAPQIGDPLDARIIARIQEAIQKKDEQALHTFVPSTLRAYLLTLADPPAS